MDPPRPARGALIAQHHGRAPIRPPGSSTSPRRDTDPRREPPRSPTRSHRRFPPTARRSRSDSSTSRSATSSASSPNLEPEDSVGRSQLSGQLQRLRALRASQGRNAAIVEPRRAIDHPDRAGHPACDRARASSSRSCWASGPWCSRREATGALRSADQLEELTGRPSAQRHPVDRLLEQAERELARGGGIPDAAGRPDLLQRRAANRQRRDHEPGPGGRQDDGGDPPRLRAHAGRQGRDPRGRRPPPSAHRPAARARPHSRHRRRPRRRTHPLRCPRGRRRRRPSMASHYRRAAGCASSRQAIRCPTRPSC